MRQRHLYEYAVIRVVPVVEREEFVNAGIILLCKRERFLRVMLDLNEKRIKALCDQIDMEQLKENLDAFCKIATGAKGCGPIAEMDETSRFRWLTAVKSATIQTSRPHPGLSYDLEETVTRLFSELVKA
jgi:hypothetical protein